jgi:hypothetical protein
VDQVDAMWVGFLLRFDLARQKELLAKFGMEAAAFQALPVFLLLAIILILAVLYFIEAQRRERLDPEDRLYRDLIKALKRLEITKEANEGPLSLMAKIRAGNPGFSERVAEVLEPLIWARYGDRALTRAEFQTLRRKIRSLKGAHPVQ